jgi:probable DNA metabolism protein
MKTKKIYICEDTVEGIFTAIYDAWSSRYGHDNIYIEVQTATGEGYTMELFSEYINVKTDDGKAEKVAVSIRNKISLEAYEMVCNAAWSDTEGKGDTIYRFLILGFAMGNKVVDYLSNDVVMNIFAMNRNVGNEAHHILGFLRFKQTKGNILLAKLRPRNDILLLIAPHFADRFGTENFIIYDEKRKSAILHRSGYSWVYTNADNLNLDLLDDLSDQEKEFQILWKTFFETIAIEERKNPGLQRNNMPKRFRSNMTEFNV